MSLPLHYAWTEQSDTKGVEQLYQAVLIGLNTGPCFCGPALTPCETWKPLQGLQLVFPVPHCPGAGFPSIW